MKNDALNNLSDIFTLNCFCFVFNTSHSFTVVTGIGQKYQCSCLDTCVSPLWLRLPNYPLSLSLAYEYTATPTYVLLFSLPSHLLNPWSDP